MASEEVQRSWTGNAGTGLLRQTSAFVRALSFNYGHITGKKFDILDVDTSGDGAALTELPKGQFPISALAVPAGKRMVAVKLNVKAGADPWAWAPTLGDFTVVDGAATSVKPSGAIAIVTKARGGAPKLLANYKANGTTCPNTTPPAQKAWQTGKLIFFPATSLALAKG